MTLKSMNNVYITPLVFFNASIIFFYASGAPLKLESIYKITELYPNEGILALIVALLSFAINNFISSQTKASIIYFKFTCPLPACWAFSKLVPQDPRIDQNEVEHIFPNSSNLSPNDQNSLWYKSIYQKVKEDKLIKKSHQYWLLYRDITSIMLLFLIALVGLGYFFGFNEYFYSYLTMLLLMLILFRTAAYNAGKQFVTNSIACHLNS